MWNHLGRTHFTMEPVAISLQQQVHPSHPLSLLLDTHMRFHLANNNLAHSTLVADGGQVDTCWAGTRSESLQICYQVHSPASPVSPAPRCLFLAGQSYSVAF